MIDDQSGRAVAADSVGRMGAERSDRSTRCTAIAFLLERAARADVPGAGLPHRRRVSSAALTADELGRRIDEGTLTELKGIGKITAAVVTEARGGRGAGLPGEAARRRPTRRGCRRRRRAAGGAARRLPHALGLVRRRQSPIEEMARGRPRPRPRVHGADRPLAAADRGQRAVAGAAACEQLDVVADAQRGARAVPHPDRHRGRHPRRRLARPGAGAARPARRRRRAACTPSCGCRART